MSKKLIFLPELLKKTELKCLILDYFHTSETVLIKNNNKTYNKKVKLPKKNLRIIPKYLSSKKWDLLSI
jgi:hypothetical protein